MSRRAALEALDRVDPDLGAFIELDPDSVLERASTPRPGRLSGVLVAVKDLVDTAGIRTTYGAEIFADHVPEKNAPVIDWLEGEGAIVLGKTNLNEFAYGVTGYNPHYGPVLNPAGRERTAGGSSGGSAAAVAAGVCRLAIATDTSGSTRLPAACCGVYGFKAARGAYDLSGIFPLAPTFDSLGLIAAGVEDIQAVLGLDELPDAAAVRIGRIDHDVDPPSLPDAHWVVFRRQVADVHAELFSREAERYAKDSQWKLRVPVGDKEAAAAALLAWHREFLAAVADFDVVLGPVLDGGPPTLAEVLDDYERDAFVVGERMLRHTPAYNQLGWPAIAVPTADGPVQLAARPGDEAALLAAAAAIGLHSRETVSP
jgi:aspartyl-tRNA(Asn)/glutamyl-tRNA(Gln) amidotransferase subunit A